MKDFLFSVLKRRPRKPVPYLHSSSQGAMEGNIVANPTFENGLEGWSTSYSCVSSLCDSTSMPGIRPQTGKAFVPVSRRTQGWQGIEQALTPRLVAGVEYQVTATVRIAGDAQSADVFATARLQSTGSETKYLRLGSVTASMKEWRTLRGTFALESLPEQVYFYLEGPPSGVDILVDSVTIKPSQSSNADHGKEEKETDGAVIHNQDFEEGLREWSGRSCTLLLGEAANIPHVRPCGGRHFAVATKRCETWHGVEQEVTGRLTKNRMYEVQATVRIHGMPGTVEVLATLYICKDNMQEQYSTIGRAKVSCKDWTTLRGSFTLHNIPRKAIIFLEGAPPGVDILVDSFSVHLAKAPEPTPPPKIEDPKFGCNIVENSSFDAGLSCWSPMGSCSLYVASGGPKIIPVPAKESLQHHGNFTGKYVVATSRKNGWEGPSQKLTGKVQLSLPYQVSAWVRVGGRGCGSHKVNVALSIDGQWVSGGETVASPNTWSEICGAFRLEKKPSDVFIYVQGPEPGVDIMVANLQVFPVDRAKNFLPLKKQADQFRQRDVVLRVRGSSSRPVSLRIHQKKSAFTIGACIGRNNLENSDYVDFFLKNFDCAVFENELKWSWTEPSRGKLNYREADELCNFCSQHKLPVRGHCVFWEVEGSVQSWLKTLSRNELQAAVENRMTSLIQRYKGVFQHYDVNNEMLHGDFFESRLGKDIRARMFQRIHQLDPSPKLFVNDYHVEGGQEAACSPERYVQQVQSLMEQGAPVGGIGIQGHLEVPVGSIQRQAFDKLAMLGLPIWITELDVSSSNDYVRADDVETVLREAFAHPAVEGVVFWGFWQGCCRDGGHLVNVDSSVNEAGRRLQSLKREWLTQMTGQTNRDGEFGFRGYLGSYVVQVDGGREVAFEVVSGNGCLFIDV